jgi:alkaline phosphatase
VVDLDGARAGLPAKVVAVDDAVRVLIAWVEANSSWTETLLLVGADHETGGYQFDADPAAAEFPDAPYHTRALVPWYVKGPGDQSRDQLCGLPDLFLLMSGQL